MIEDTEDGKFTEKLAEKIQALDSNKRAVYRIAKIYLPCDILKVSKLFHNRFLAIKCL